MRVPGHALTCQIVEADAGVIRKGKHDLPTTSAAVPTPCIDWNYIDRDEAKEWILQLASLVKTADGVILKGVPPPPPGAPAEAAPPPAKAEEEVDDPLGVDGHAREYLPRSSVGGELAGRRGESGRASTTPRTSPWPSAPRLAHESVRALR